MTKYLIGFECLTNHIVGLPHPFLLSCFISCLQPKIRYKVQALQPMALPQAMALAKLQEDKLEDCCHFNCSKPLSNPLPPPLPPANPQPQLVPSTIAPIRSVAPSSLATPRPHYHRLSLNEITDCHEKGLCYNYDENFGPKHHCRAHFFLLITKNEDAHAPPRSPAKNRYLHKSVLMCCPTIPPTRLSVCKALSTTTLLRFSMMEKAHITSSRPGSLSYWVFLRKEIGPCGSWWVTASSSIACTVVLTFPLPFKGTILWPTSMICPSVELVWSWTSNVLRNWAQL